MRFEEFSFGSIWIDGITHDHDVVIDHRGGQQAQEESVQEISRRLRPHAAVAGGTNPLEVPPTGGRHRGLRQIAGDGGGAV